MNKVTRFIKTSIVYFIGTVLSKVLSILLLPIYTSYLSPELYGEYDLYVSLINLIAPIAFIQIWDSVYRFAFDSDNKEWKQRTISNGFVVCLLGSLLYCFLHSLISIKYPTIRSLTIYLYGLFVAFIYLYTVICRVYLNNLLLIVSGLVNTIITFLLNILFIIYFKMGIDALYVSSIIGSIVQILIIEIREHAILSFRASYVSINNIKQMAKFSFPLCINTISYWLLSGYTKIVITNILGAESNGLYSIANKFTVLVTLLVSVFQFAWNEMIYLSANEKDNNKLYEKGISIIARLLLLGSGVFIIVIKLLFPYLVNKTYYDSFYIIPIALIGVAANSFASFTGTIFLSDKNSKLLVLTVFISAIANIFLIPLGCYSIGLIGAIGALGISYFINAFIRVFYLKNRYRIKIKFNYMYSAILLICSLLTFYLIDNILILLLFAIFYCIFSLWWLYPSLKIIYTNILSERNQLQ